MPDNCVCRACNGGVGWAAQGKLNEPANDRRAALPDPDQAALDALRRLLAIARTDTGQARRVADFLLSWWNARGCGGWDPTELWGLDDAIVVDVLAVVGLIARRHDYPTAYGLGPEFEALVRAWRPALFEERPR